MNWKILVGGSFFIIIIFSVFLGFQFIQNRGNLLNIPEGNQVSTFKPLLTKTPEERRLAAKSEANTSRQLVRGYVFRYSQENNTFGIAVEAKQPNGIMGVIGVVDIVIDPDRINEFLCWPEFNKTPAGIDVDMKKTFISMGADNTLYLKGESKKQIEAVGTQLNNSPYVFAFLATAVEDLIPSIENSKDLDAQYVDQLSILGCNETN
ncbi:MAG: hypothetical protein OEX81_00235 [Candidatus Pacebacteria bacterium]|nr:hypothetical protein [Candidatus Paceibacterota bacterium]